MSEELTPKKMVSKNNLASYHNKLMTKIKSLIGSGGSGGTTAPEEIRGFADDVYVGDDNHAIYIEAGEPKACMQLTAKIAERSTRSDYAMKLGKLKDTELGKPVEVEGISTNKNNIIYFENGEVKESYVTVPGYSAMGNGMTPLSNCDTVCINNNSGADILLPKLALPDGMTVRTSHHTFINNGNGTPKLKGAAANVKIYNRDGTAADATQGVAIAPNSVVPMLVISMSSYTYYKLL